MILNMSVVNDLGEQCVRAANTENEAFHPTRKDTLA
jgi:hypothetical protein